MKQENLEDILKTFEPISLDQMSSVKLMNRTDTKFVTNLEKLKQLLKMACDEYYVQEIDGERNLEYDTTYYDTPDFHMYCMHQWKHTNRQKIRFRTYCINGLQFMEVKTKNNHKRTKKQRIKVVDMDLTDEEKRTFLGQHLHYDVDSLQPALNNHFARITLVNKGMTERLTIDSGVHFNNMVNKEQMDMKDLVIIELKRDGHVFSPILKMLRMLQIHPHGFSKYCIGSALTNRDLPYNRFKQKAIEVRKLTGLDEIKRQK
ncbi:MAG: polyphosphate polymerase domain-containing protein [Prevotella sp.]|nr:polyphosphate polymerase domain-containing protein [Prevotella sp.]MBR3080946.1 polyphosphate polymerase domain-containing protein [Prevotella sp.]